MDTFAQTSGVPPIVDGAIVEVLALEQWRALAARVDFDERRLSVLPEISVSIRTLQRIFANRFGAPPSQFLLQWRAEAARDYVALTGVGNKHVAAKLGFANEVHLCHVFKQVLNRTPQSFSLRTKRAQLAALGEREPATALCVESASVV